jgi:hypothetical protein
MADFQEETFEAIIPSLYSLRKGEHPYPRRFWVERTKKSSKDGDIAALVLWLIAFPSRPFLAQICAANSKQAAIIQDRAVDIVHFNPWLNDLIEIVEGRIRNKHEPRKVRTIIESTGSAGEAQGPTPDLLILNELVHVDKWGVMEAHMQNADGVPNGVVIISTNAGVKGTAAHVWRKNAIKNPKRWSVHLWSQPTPWVRPEDIEDAKRRDPIGVETSRLWYGKWVSGTGNAVSEEEIDSCFVLEGPSLEPDNGWMYLGGLDLGVSHDHAAVVILGINRQDQRICVATMKAWVPNMKIESGKEEVDLMDVERFCIEMHRRYRISWLGYDPAAGGSFMAQRLRKINLPMREAKFSSTTVQTAMATSFVQAVKDGKLECYEDSEGRLRRDFGKFAIEHKPPSRYKLVAVADEFGHADVGVALVLQLPKAMEMLETWGGFLPDDVLVYNSDGDVSEEDLEDAPDIIKGIFDYCDDMADEHRKR